MSRMRLPLVGVRTVFLTVLGLESWARSLGANLRGLGRMGVLVLT